MKIFALLSSDLARSSVVAHVQGGHAMFVRVKKNGAHEYLQLVSSERINGKVRQRVIGTLGRRDLLESSRDLEGLAVSIGKFARHAAVLADHRAGKTETLSAASLGPALVF